MFPFYKTGIRPSMSRIGGIIEAAGKAGVNVICHRKPGQCRSPLYQGEVTLVPVRGIGRGWSSTLFLSELAAKYRMVIISPIRER